MKDGFYPWNPDGSPDEIGGPCETYEVRIKIDTLDETYETFDTQSDANEAFEKAVESLVQNKLIKFTVKQVFILEDDWGVSYKTLKTFAAA